MGIAYQPFGLGSGTGTDRGHSFRVCLPGNCFRDLGGQVEDMAERVDHKVVGGDVIVMDENGPRLFPVCVDVCVDVRIYFPARRRFGRSSSRQDGIFCRCFGQRLGPAGTGRRKRPCDSMAGVRSCLGWLHGDHRAESTTVMG